MWYNKYRAVYHRLAKCGSSASRQGGGFFMPYKDPEKAKAQRANYRAAHLEEERASHAAKYAAHPKEARTRSAAWAKAHPEATRTKNARQRARKRNLPATLSTEQWEAIKRAYQHRCAYCGKKETKKRPLTQDHVVPLKKGGGTTSDNIVPACGPCNFRKSAGPPPSIPPIRLLV